MQACPRVALISFVSHFVTRGGLLTDVHRYGSQDADFVLTKAVGEALPAVVRQQTTILEHMTKDDKLDNYYKNALGFVELNRLMANVVGHISHRYPQMNICEIGAGTGGATKGIIEKLGTAYSSYTYTDISSGFFNKAQENFSSSKDRMIYKTLDITVNPVDQGFEAHSYDLILAANVLHATPDLVETLKNVRRLLRPGGFLVMMEFTDMSPMRMGLIIGGLPGWWIGRDSGRKYSPAVDLNAWNENLLASGFAGVKTSTPVLDPVVMPACIIVSQATDTDMKLLRQPLIAQPSQVASDLIIVGGNGVATALVVSQILIKLEPYYKRIIQATSWEVLDVKTIPESCAMLNLSECDSLFWKDMTVDRFEKLKTILLAASNLLWITWGSDRENPDSAMTYGFFRCLCYELPETLIQIIDLETPDSVSSSILAERLLRLETTASMRKNGSLNTKLWTTEPEVRLREGRFLVPRLRPEMQSNDRYNSAKREILKDVDLRNAIVTLSWNSTKYVLREEEQPSLPSVLGRRRVRVDSSLLSSTITPAGRLFFSLGTDMDSKEHVLSVSTNNASAISVPQEWTVTVEVGRSIDAQYLSFLSGYLMSQHVASLMPAGGTTVVFEADPGLASLISRQLAAIGSRVLFITTSQGTTKRNWTYMHPRIADRHLAAALPKNTSMYLDLSAASPTFGSEALGTRIAAMLPPLCEKYDASILIAAESTKPLGSNDDAIQALLEKANAFAAAQFNGVPDGMPLRMIPISQIVGGALKIEPMSIVHWQGETIVPVQVEPIFNRRDLFVGDKTYWLIGLAGDLGRSLCDFMVEHGARHVVLTSRSPKVDAEWTETHRLQGATITYIQGLVKSFRLKSDHLFPRS